MSLSAWGGPIDTGFYSFLDAIAFLDCGHESKGSVKRKEGLFLMILKMYHLLIWVLHRLVLKII